MGVGVGAWVGVRSRVSSFQTPANSASSAGSELTVAAPRQASAGVGVAVASKRGWGPAARVSCNAHCIDSAQSGLCSTVGYLVGVARVRAGIAMVSRMYVYV